MIQIIVGEKGKGKTKILLEKVNEAVSSVSGNMVYLDKDTEKMYELHNQVRLINVKDYLVSNCNEFLGFICGILSQDHDLEKIYLDSVLKISCANQEEVPYLLDKLNEISGKFEVDFIISISVGKADIPAAYQDSIIEAL